MADLAIRGHATRGEEVIKILEMLGGNNKYHINITECNLLYTIRESDNVIIGTYPNSSISQIYTIEEFLEKFPYKVGDKVYNIIHNENQTITNMFWDVHENEIIYQTINNEYVYVNYLQPYKEETMEIPEKLMPKIDFNEYCKDKYILDLGNYEIKEENGKTYAVRKRPQYPKTYEECCEVLGYEPDRQTVTGYDAELIENLQTLKLCRDAYWKMAGEEMGLGKPWEPDWENCCATKYAISCVNNKIKLFNAHEYNYILAFPSEEMRDAFYENFKDLIEECKELL